MHSGGPGGVSEELVNDNLYALLPIHVLSIALATKAIIPRVFVKERGMVSTACFWRIHEDMPTSLPKPDFLLSSE